MLIINNSFNYSCSIAETVDQFITTAASKTKYSAKCFMNSNQQRKNHKTTILDVKKATPFHRRFSQMPITCCFYAVQSE